MKTILKNALMKIFTLSLLLLAAISAQAQFQMPTVTHLPYPGTVSTVLDGDLIRVNYSVVIPGATVEAHYQEWGPNPTSGAEELWTSNALIYVSANLLSNNYGINAFVPQIRIPLQLVTTVGNQTLYLASIKGDTLFTSGRKTGWTNHWNIKLYFMVMNTPDGMNWTAYESAWTPVNIASLPAMDSGTFYAGTVFNPEQPSYVKPGKGPVKKK